MVRPAKILESLITLFLQGSFASGSAGIGETSIVKVGQKAEQQIEMAEIADLPASLVRSLFKKAKRMGRQEFALVYVLFGAGLTLTEILHLERSHSVVEPQQHILQVNYGQERQVPLNQWVMGFRYGSNSINPLIQWLKSRRDEQPSIFINDASDAISAAEIQTMWRNLTSDLITPQGESPGINQARQTWCVEMFMRGIELEDLSILSGMDIEQLQHYAQRARNKAALESAARLDKKI